jgi:hypothetical protein
MSFPNASRSRKTLFWVVTVTSLFFLGITATGLPELVSGHHPAALLFQRIGSSESSLVIKLAVLLGVAGIGYVVVGAWGALAFIMFLLLARLDRDVAENVAASGLASPDVVTKVALFMFISSAVSLLAMSLVVYLAN